MLPTETELRERYSSYSNKRLLSIVHNQNEYTPQALEAAKAELAGRNITSDDVDGFLDELEERKVTAKILSCIPLRSWEKALFFFVWFAPLFFGGAFRMNYSEDGLILKLKQSRVFAVAGFVSLILNTAISMTFKLNGVAPILLLAAFFVVFVWLEKKVVYELTH
jgi:hypothetical protein